eukprot:Pompholyxophrys_punicea_v1_NODE_252_length_2530_cov_4.538586.p3 type:complete len:117 gc:universal NODE_252_length_2530_cov_4.538586:1787-1437(-)
MYKSRIALNCSVPAVSKTSKRHVSPSSERLIRGIGGEKFGVEAEGWITSSTIFSSEPDPKKTNLLPNSIFFQIIYLFFSGLRFFGFSFILPLEMLFLNFETSRIWISCMFSSSGKK